MVDQLRSSLAALKALIIQERRNAEATEAKHAEELRDFERQLEVVKSSEAALEGRLHEALAGRRLAEQQFERLSGRGLGTLPLNELKRLHDEMEEGQEHISKRIRLQLRA